MSTDSSRPSGSNPELSRNMVPLSNRSPPSEVGAKTTATRTHIGRRPADVVPVFPIIDLTQEQDDTASPSTSLPSSSPNGSLATYWTCQFCTYAGTPSFYNACEVCCKSRHRRPSDTDDDLGQMVFEDIDPASIVIPDSYPRLQYGRVTHSFMEELMPFLKDQGFLHRQYVIQILEGIGQLLLKAPSLVDITIPAKCKLTVCGDVHGQYYDLCNIFHLNGVPSEDNPYLFNGDFVDRGSFSVECVLTLFGYKLLYPNHFFLARGNHETHDLNSVYGFRGEVMAKYDELVYDLFTNVFNLLPSSHLINRRVLVMHGGLFSQPDVSLQDLRNIDRNRQPPESGLMCELLWSDPCQKPGVRPSKRGIACAFGPDITDKFCTANGLDYVIRSHEYKRDGYEVAHGGRCITIFSAPNYCDKSGNLGAWINIRGNNLTPQFVTFAAVPHPNVPALFYADPEVRGGYN